MSVSYTHLDVYKRQASAYAKYGAKMILVDLSPAVEETAEKLRREYGAEVITAVANVADRAQDVYKRQPPLQYIL